MNTELVWFWTLAVDTSCSKVEDEATVGKQHSAKNQLETAREQHTFRVVTVDGIWLPKPGLLHELLLLLLGPASPSSPPFERKRDAFVLNQIPQIRREDNAKDKGHAIH